MRKGPKAALLSGLVFPGLGHVFLRRYLRGSVLVVAALAATSFVVNGVVNQAQAVVDRINSGDIPADTADLAAMIASSGNDAAGSTANMALIVLGVCWLIGIVDSYRLGALDEKQKD